MKRIILIALTCLIVLAGCASGTPTWQDQYDLGIRYLQEGNYEEAIIAFTAAIEIDPKNVDAYLGRAEAYMNSDDVNGFVNALADYSTVIEIDDNCEEAYVGMANAYMKQGDYEKAKEALDQVSNESIKSDLLAEIEKSMAESLELPEIQLENVSYTFSKDRDIIESNEGAVGGMRIKANVLSSDSNAKALLIAEWGQNLSECSQTQIKEKALRYAQIWKDANVNIEQDPYEIGVLHPVDEEELGTHNEVLLIGIDENCNPVGYAFVKGEIPSKEEALKEVKVVEAVNYTREVNPAFNLDAGFSPRSHSVSIPKIDGNSAAINAFNEKILNAYMKYVDELKNTSEDFSHTYITYDFEIIDGIVGIMIMNRCSHFSSYIGDSFGGYYYDSNNDEEICFEEYLKRLHVDFDKMTDLVNDVLKREGDASSLDAEPALGNTLSEHRIRKALISENGFIATFVRIMGMGGTESTITIECPISDITSDEAVQKAPASDPVQILTDFYNDNKEELSAYTPIYGMDCSNMINAYLADLDNDGTPELCIKYNDFSDEYTHISIYRVAAGQVILSLNCIDVWNERMGHLNKDYKLLFDNGEIRTCIIYSDTQYDDSIEYYVYNWDDNVASLVEDIAFRRRNGIYEFSNKLDNTGYPDYSTVSSAEYIRKKEDYTKKFEEIMLDTDHCGFYDIWNLQK